MRIAHACLGCGADLSRVRAERGLVPQLPLVRCPACAWCCVRRRHPLETLRRDLQRRFVAVSALVAQAALLALATGAVFSGGADLVRNDFEADLELLGLAPACAGLVFAGAWVRVTLRRRSIVMRWLIWAVWIYGVWTLLKALSLGRLVA